MSDGDFDKQKQVIKDIILELHKGLSFEEALNPLVEEVDGMIFKEENILFPTSLEKLQTEDWVDVLKESEQVGYAFIEPPADTAHLVDTLKKKAAEEPFLEDSRIRLPSGELSPKQLLQMLNALPVDITFVDQDDVVRYFSENEERIFVRTRAIIGRKVENCHPPRAWTKCRKSSLLSKTAVETARSSGST